MAYFVAGLMVLALLYYIAKSASQSNPAKLASVFKTLLGLVLMLVCVFLAATGRWMAALPLAAFAFSLFGLRGPGGFSMGRRFPFGGGATRKSAGQTSTVSSAFLRMELDHDTKQMDGMVLSGPYDGRALSSLQAEDLRALWQGVQSDSDSAALLEAYLDSRFANWRVDFQTDYTAGHGNSTSSSTLTEKEAYEILGLAPGASAADIRTAHRRLIKRMHPDSGGSAFLAAKLNEAKDRLLNRH